MIVNWTKTVNIFFRGGFIDKAKKMLVSIISTCGMDGSYLYV